MKKFFLISGLISGIIITLIGLYFLFNIYFVFSQNDNTTYDGYGEEYQYQEPHSDHTLIGVIGFIGGFNLIAYCCEKLNKEENNK